MSGLKTQRTAVSLLPAASRTASANGTAIATTNYTGQAIFILDAAAITGTTPTASYAIAESATSDGTYVTIASFAAPTTSAASYAQAEVNIDETKKYIRAQLTASATVASIAAVSAVLTPRY